jgi:hypothetical protein
LTLVLTLLTDLVTEETFFPVLLQPHPIIVNISIYFY